MPRIKATKVTTATKVRRDVTSAGSWGQSPATLEVTKVKQCSREPSDLLQGIDSTTPVISRINEL